MSEDKMPVFVETREFWWPVRVELPGDDGFESQEFEARMRLATDDELNDPELSGDSQHAAVIREQDILKSVISDLRGINIGDRSPEEVIAKMVTLRPYRAGLARAMFDAHMGGKARTGN